MQKNLKKILLSLLLSHFLLAEDEGHNFEELANRFNDISQIAKKVSGPPCTFFDSLFQDSRISNHSTYKNVLLEIEKKITEFKAKKPNIPNYWAKEFKDAKLFSELTSSYEKNLKDILKNKTYNSYKLEELLILKELLLSQTEKENLERFNKDLKIVHTFFNYYKPVPNYSEAVSRIAINTERQLLCPTKDEQKKKLNDIRKINTWYKMSFTPGVSLPLEIRIKLINLPNESREQLVQMIQKGFKSHFENQQFLLLLLNPTKALIQELAENTLHTKVSAQKTFAHPIFLKDIAQITQKQNPPYSIENYYSLSYPEELVLRQWAIKQLNSKLEPREKNSYLSLLSLIDKWEPGIIDIIAFNEKNPQAIPLSQPSSIPLSELDVNKFIEGQSQAIAEPTLEYLLHHLPLQHQAGLLEKKYEHFKSKNKNINQIAITEEGDLLARKEFLSAELEALKTKRAIGQLTEKQYESYKKSLLNLFAATLKNLEDKKSRVTSLMSPPQNDKGSESLNKLTDFLAGKVYSHKAEMGTNIEAYGLAIVSSSKDNKVYYPEDLLKMHDSLNENIITFKTASPKLNAALIKIQKDLQSYKVIEALKDLEKLSETDPKLYKELLTTIHYFPDRNQTKELITFAKVPPQIRQHMDIYKHSHILKQNAHDQVGQVLKNYPKLSHPIYDGQPNYEISKTVKNLAPEDIAKYWHDWETAVQNQNSHQLAAKTATSLTIDDKTLNTLLNKDLADRENNDIPNNHPTNTIKLSLPLDNGRPTKLPYDFCVKNTVKPFVDLIWKETFTPITVASPNPTVAKMILDHAPISFEKYQEAFDYSSDKAKQIENEDAKATLLLTIRESFLAELAVPEHSQFQNQTSSELKDLAKENILKIILSIDAYLLKHYEGQIRTDQLGIKSADDFKNKIQEEAKIFADTTQRYLKETSYLRQGKDKFITKSPFLDTLKNQRCNGFTNLNSIFNFSSYEKVLKGSKHYSDRLNYYGIPTASRVAIINLPKHLRDILDASARFGETILLEKNRNGTQTDVLASLSKAILNPSPENIIKMVQNNPELQAYILEQMFSKNQTHNGAPKGIITNKLSELNGITRFRKLTPEEEQEKRALTKLVDEYEKKASFSSEKLTEALRSSYSKSELDKLSLATDFDMEKLKDNPQNDSRNFIAFLSVALSKGSKHTPQVNEYGEEIDTSLKFKPHELHPDYIIHQENKLKRLFEAKSPKIKDELDYIVLKSHGVNSDAKAKLYNLPDESIDQLYMMAHYNNALFNEALEDPTADTIDFKFAIQQQFKESEKAGSLAVHQWKQENELRDFILDDLAKNKTLSVKSKIYLNEMANRRLEKKFTPQKIQQICEDKNCTSTLEMKSAVESEKEKSLSKIKLEIEAELRHIVGTRLVEAYRNKVGPEKFKDNINATLMKMTETSQEQVKNNLSEYKKHYKESDPILSLIEDLYKLYPIEFKHQFEDETQQEPIQNIAFDALKQSHTSQNPILDIADSIKRSIQKDPNDSFEIAEKAWLNGRYCATDKETNLFEDPSYPSKRHAIKVQERELLAQLYHLTKKAKDLFAEKVFLEARNKRYEFLATSTEFQAELKIKSSAENENFQKRLKELPNLVRVKEKEYELAVLAYKNFTEEAHKKNLALNDTLLNLNSQTQAKLNFAGNIPNFGAIPIPDVLQLQKALSKTNNLCLQTLDPKEAIDKLSNKNPNFKDKATENLDKYFFLRAMSEEIAEKLYDQPNWQQHPSVKYWITQATSGMYGIKISPVKAALILSEEMNNQKQKQAKVAPLLATLKICGMWDEKGKQLTIQKFNGSCSEEQLKQTLNSLQKIKPELFQTQELAMLKFSPQIPAGNYLLELMSDKWASDGKPKSFAFGKAALILANQDPTNPKFAFSNLEEEQKKYGDLLSEALTILKTKYPKALANVKGEYNRAMYDHLFRWGMTKLDLMDNMEAENNFIATDRRLREIAEILSTQGGTLPIKPKWAKDGEAKTADEWQAHLANQFNNQMRMDIQDTHNLVQEAVVNSGIGLGVDLASLMLTGGSASVFKLGGMSAKGMASFGKGLAIWKADTAVVKHLMHNPNVWKQLGGQAMHGLRMSELLNIGGYVWREGTEAFKPYDPEYVRNFSITDHYHEHYKSSALFALSPFSTAAFARVVPQAVAPALGGFVTSMGVNTPDMVNGKLDLAQAAMHSAQTSIYFLGMDQKAAALLPSALVKIKGAPFATSFGVNSTLSAAIHHYEWNKEYNRVSELHKKLEASHSAPDDEEKYKKILADLNKPGAYWDQQREGFIQGMFSHALFAGKAEAHAKQRRQAMNLARVGEAKGGVIFNSKQPVEIMKVLGKPKNERELKEKGLQVTQFLTGEEIIALENKAQRGNLEAKYILDLWVPEATHLSTDRLSKILKLDPTFNKNKQLHQVRVKLQEAAYKQIQSEISGNIQAKKSKELNENVKEILPLVSTMAQSGTKKDAFDTITPRQIRLLDEETRNAYLSSLAHFYKIKNDEGQFNKFAGSRNYTNQKNWIDVVKEYRTKQKL